MSDQEINYEVLDHRTSASARSAAAAKPRGDS